MSDNKPTMPRRDFIEKLSQKAALIVSFCSITEIAKDAVAQDSGDYDPTQHNYAMGLENRKFLSILL